MNEHLKYDIDIAVAVGEGDISRTSKCFIFIDFFSKHAYIAGVYCDIMMMTSLTEGLHRSTAMGVIAIRRRG